MLQFPALSEDCNISHFVTTRQGGVSKGAYASFNPGEYSGDNPEAVRANRKLLSDAIGIPTERIFAPFQVHGAEVRSIEPSFLSLPCPAVCSRCEGGGGCSCRLAGNCTADYRENRSFPHG